MLFSACPQCEATFTRVRFGLGGRVVLESSDVLLRPMLSGDTRSPGQHRMYARH